jgi:peptidylprolyl isomerase
MSSYFMLLGYDFFEEIMSRESKKYDGVLVNASDARGGSNNCSESLMKKRAQMKFSTMNPLMTARTAVGLLLASAVGLASAQSSADNKVVASVGKAVVTQQDVSRALQNLSPAERTAVQNNPAGIEAWLKQNLATEALLQDAKSKGWDSKPEVKARIDAAVKEITSRVITSSYLDSVTQLPAGYPTDADIKTAYDQNKDKLMLPERFRVAQIYLPADANDKDAAKRVQDEAKKLATQAKKGDFAELARVNSKDAASAARGGEVGMLPINDMLPEMRDTIQKMKAGQVSDPVQSANGWHILKLLETQPAGVATVEEVKPQLENLLRQQRKQQLTQQYLTGLMPADQVKIDQTSLNAVIKK